MHNHQSMRNDHSALSGEGGVVGSGMAGLLSWCVNSWLAFTGPDAQHFSNSIADQECLRRARLLSALFLIIPVSILLSIPNVLLVPIDWIAIVLFVLLGSVSMVFNRYKMITWSGLTFVISMDSALIVLLLIQPDGLKNSNIPDLDLFIGSLLVGGFVLPRVFLPVIAFVQIGIIIALFVFVPHNPLLTQEISVNQHGSGYSLLSDAIILQVIGMIIAWLNRWSMDRTLLRASRAEELAEARAYMAEQNRQMIAQRQRLDYGINVLKEVQTQAANGDYTARARLQDNELVPLAMGLNLMIERINRAADSEQKYYRLEQALVRLIEVQDKVMYNDVLTQYQSSGTVVDKIYPVLERYHYLARCVIRCIPILDKMRNELHLQKAQLVRLTSTHALMRPTAQLLMQDTVESYISRAGDDRYVSQSSSRVTRRNEQIPVPTGNARERIQQNIGLIEDAYQLSTQLQEINAHCIQEIKALNLALKGSEY